jgi:mRNA interferase MazF
MAPYCPDAGDFIWINFDPQEGSEQRGRRPALVLSPRIYNQRSRLCVLCPITNQAKAYPFEVAIPVGHRATGVVLADQVKSQSWDMRDAQLIGAAPAIVLARTRGLVKALLQIP